MNNIRYWLWLVLMSLSWQVTPVAAASPLSPYGADARQVSVSGLSSGAFMATQFHVAYSGSLMGAGVIAGGPYYCASTRPFFFGTDLQAAVSSCMNPCEGVFELFRSSCEALMLPDGEALAATARQLADEGGIDAVSNLADDRVYLFTGGQDDVVVSAVVGQTEAFYRAVGIQQLFKQEIPEAAHAFISDHVDAEQHACDAKGAPFINNCDNYDQAQALLSHIYHGDDDPIVPHDGMLGGSMVSFDQKAFVEDDQFQRSGLAETAFAYIPSACETGPCRVHVAFHGCRQSAAEFATNQLYFRDASGYSQVADDNRIIVLYPQIRAKELMQSPTLDVPYNPRGCWDFWGYSDDQYYQQGAVQMAAVKAMVERLTQPRPETAHVSRP